MGIHDGHREKMRQRFMTGGLDAFADHEILELLLYYAIPGRDTNPIAHALMERYGSLPAVLAAPMEDLKRTEGIGESAAVLLHLCPRYAAGPAWHRLGRIRSSIPPSGRERTCWSASTGRAGEVIYQLCLDRKGKLLACKRLGEGSVASADLDVRRLVENAILTGASAVILAHNHPAGWRCPPMGITPPPCGCGRPSMPSALSWRIISLSRMETLSPWRTAAI